MMNFISKLQSKPLAARKNIALFSTIAIGLVVVAIWAGMIYLSSSNQKGGKNADSSPFDSLEGLFSTVKNSISNEKAAIQESFNFKE